MEAPADRLKKWLPKETPLYRAAGCPDCAMTGYRGRFSILEVLTVTPEVERRIAAGETADHIAEAARVLRPQGLLVVVDFTPHALEFLRDEHAHRRLGFAPETVTQWLSAAGLDVIRQQSLAPEENSGGKIAVSLWLGRDLRIAVAEREVA